MTSSSKIGHQEWKRLSRRGVLTGTAGLLISVGLIDGAHATPETMQEAIAGALGETPIRPGRITLDVPPLAENGNSVSLLIEVESPMTAADHVKTIYVFAEKNPLTDVARFHLGPRAGRARVHTVIRLSQTQFVKVLAEMSDGSCWAQTAEVIVTIGGCLDPL